MSLSPTQLLRTLESFVSPLFPSHSTFNTSALALHLNLATLSHLHWFYPWSSHYCLFPGALGQLPYSFLDSILNPQQPTVHTAARVMFRKTSRDVPWVHHDQVLETIGTAQSPPKLFKLSNLKPAQLLTSLTHLFPLKPQRRPSPTLFPHSCLMTDPDASCVALSAMVCPFLLGTVSKKLTFRCNHLPICWPHYI